jgi:hypothetical protein
LLKQRVKQKKRKGKETKSKNLVSISQGSPTQLLILTLPKERQFILTSIQNSPVSGSLATVAVKPAADDDFPDVYTDLGTMLEVYLKW